MYHLLKIHLQVHTDHVPFLKLHVQEQTDHMPLLKLRIKVHIDHVPLLKLHISYIQNIYPDFNYTYKSNRSCPPTLATFTGTLYTVPCTGLIIHLNYAR